MPFPIDDEFWLETRDFLKDHARATAAILAPNEFMEFFPGTYHYNVTYALSPDGFDFVVFHKGMVHEVEPPFAIAVLQKFQPIFANPVFVVYARQVPDPAPVIETAHLRALLDQLASIETLHQVQQREPCYGCVITTYNRPQGLARSLPQILALGAPVVVVDDASSEENYRENQRITSEHGVPLLRMPENRGLPNAINNGIGYWLADPDIDWISYFQDDVDVHPDLFKVFAAIQDPQERPLLTGRDAVEHRTYEIASIGGYKVYLKRSMPGVHLHAHRDYWRAVLPIPTPYVGAPKPIGRKHGQGADEDWWITAWSPQSVTKQGKYAVCVPGLVRTFDQTGSASTWRNVVEAENDQELTGAERVTTEAIAQLPPPVHFATPAAPTPDPELVDALAGVKILMDGYNLELATGTGIKTYSTTLVKSLQDMGAQVDVLLSRDSSKKDKLLDEVLFFDQQIRRGNLITELLGLLKGMAKSYSGPFYRAWRRTAIGDLVLKEGEFGADFIRYAQSFNLPRCYEIANFAFSLNNRITDIYMPEKMDIWHVTYPLPIRIKGAKKITTVHDLIPLRLPYTTLDNKKDFYGKIRNAIDDSEVIIAVSENTKKDLLTYFDADPDRIAVTYQPVTLQPLQVEAGAIARYLRRYGLDYQNYLLFVGAIEPKKNVGRLIEAYASLDTDMPLVIVGKKAWSWERELARIDYLFDGSSKQEVKLLEYVSLESLKYLYQGAYCLVFPSLYEGFGLPPIEAMTLGCPVITSNLSCLPEICGAGALYASPYDVNDIRNKMEKLLSDRTLRDQLVEKGRENAQRFSRENYQKRLKDAYFKALNRS